MAQVNRLSKREEEVVELLLQGKSNKLIALSLGISDRPYREAWPAKKVREYIQSLSGTHFDPQVVKICLESGVFTE